MYANSKPITPPTKASAKSQKQIYFEACVLVNFSRCGGGKITPLLKMSTINWPFLYCAAASIHHAELV